MWYSNILVAYDGSQPSRKALHVAKELAEQNPQAKLTFVSVVKILASTESDVTASQAVFDRAREIELELTQFADHIPNETDVRLLKGTSPAELILRCAQDRGCDLIVMGSRGQGGVKGYLGSVSYAVVKLSPICVLVAKEDPKA